MVGAIELGGKDEMIIEIKIIINDIKLPQGLSMSMEKKSQ